MVHGLWAVLKEESIGFGDGLLMGGEEMMGVEMRHRDWTSPSSVRRSRNLAIQSQNSGPHRGKVVLCE
ncbi:hypothetical protein STEG23_001604, partial [Scotinomys teguina]